MRVRGSAAPTRRVSEGNPAGSACSLANASGWCSEITHSDIALPTAARPSDYQGVPPRKSEEVKTRSASDVHLACAAIRLWLQEEQTVSKDSAIQQNVPFPVNGIGEVGGPVEEDREVAAGLPGVFLVGGPGAAVVGVAGVDRVRVVRLGLAEDRLGVAITGLEGGG